MVVKNINFLSLFLVVLVSTSGIPINTTSAAITAAVSSPYTFNFTTDENLVETGSMDSSSSLHWYLNSGAKMVSSSGRGGTLQGSLPSNDPWRVLYSQANPTDTDNGYHPQNLFRLVLKSGWKNFRQQIYFKISKDQLSSSFNRNSSNGVLLFNRYRDSNNLYYTGLRVDGYAVIKKKIAGRYYTLAYVKTFPGTYDRTNVPNLLPKNTWLGVRSEVTNNANGTVNIKLFSDIGWKGTWKLIAEVVDDGVKFGPVISDLGYAGIRTDFMDLIFDQYRIENI